MPETPTAVARPADAARFCTRVALPAIAAGPVNRRPVPMAVLDRFDLGGRSVAAMRALRQRYGPVLLLLRLGVRILAVPLEARDAAYVLARTPETFTPATVEKRAALAQFQPHGVLISTGAARLERRRFNEAVLQPGRRLHSLAAPIAAVVRAEAQDLVHGPDRLGWEAFSRCWWRIVRTIVLGPDARDDEQLTARLAGLRDRANWTYLRRIDVRGRDDLRRRIGAYLDRAGTDCLGGIVRAEGPAAGAAPGIAPGLDPDGQVPHWLFAFDAAGIAGFRTAAVLAARPGAAERAECGEPGVARDRPFLRACVHEALRLWPTTPLLLRDSVVPTRWAGTMVPPGTAFVLFPPYFHRDPQLPYADDFVPQIWLDGTAAAEPGLVPFSAGPAACPGEDLVAFTVATMLATLLPALEPEPAGPLAGRLPGSLNHFRLSLSLRHPGPHA